ncbi:MAG: hypothetical protein WA941_16860 [Nitrososphaeraceae archaeon]
MDGIDTILERIRVIIRGDLSKFNGQDDNATIQRCLIILYLATMHPLFRDLYAKMYGNNPLLYFSGPKLERVKREISKEWGAPIKFDRYRTARRTYEMCKSRGYVDIKKEVGNNWFFALTEKGLERCEEIVNLSYRRASSTDLSKVRVVAINNYLENTYFLALKEDGSYVLGTVDNNLKNEGITENSLIEYEQKELANDFGKLPFKCRIEHTSKDSVRILADDGSIPTIKHMSNTNIKDIESESELYYIRGKIVNRWSPDDEEGIKEIEDVDTGAVTIQDNTGKIEYIKMPYESGWQEEIIRAGTWVEAIGIFKSRLKIHETTINNSLYAPYKAEFFRPFRHRPQQKSHGRKNSQKSEHPNLKSLSSSIESISNNDPCISIPAVKRLCRQNTIEFDNFVNILKQDEYLGTVNQYVLRTLCEAFPKHSAPILLKMILEANYEWFAAVNAANCLGPPHKAIVQDELIRILKKTQHDDYNTDVAKVCIEGLGNIGVERNRYDLTDTLYLRIPRNSDTYIHDKKDAWYDKYYGHVCKALARIFLLNTLEDDSLWDNSYNLQKMMLFAINDSETNYRNPTVEIITKEIFARCTSVHTDVLVKEWLFSEEIIFRKIGAYALGKVRVSRVVPQLIKILNDRAEDAEVLAEVSMALGSIGGSDAVEALLHHQRIEHIGYALGELDDFELYDYCLQRYLQSLKKPIDKGSLIENHEAELLVYRAIGLKKDKRYVDMLRQLLHGSWPSIRGVAALALARIKGAKEISTLTKAYEESGSPWERIMTGLGLLLIRSPESNDILDHLQNDLTIDSQEYEPLLSDWRFRADVLSILRNARKPVATQIANSWETIYHKSSN